MKAIVFVLSLLGVVEVSADRIELHLCDPKTKERLKALDPEIRVFNLVFTNKTEDLWWIWEPVNITGQSCYQFEVENENGEKRTLVASMLSMETTGSAPSPMRIEPGQSSVVTMYLYPELNAPGWNYGHTWSFHGFKAGETKFTVKYRYESDEARGDWLSLYKLKGKADLEVKSEPLMIASRTGKSKKK